MTHANKESVSIDFNGVVHLVNYNKTHILCPAFEETGTLSDYRVPTCVACIASETFDRESDADLLARVAHAYGMWGAWLGAAMEAKGQALDEMAATLEVYRLGVDRS